MKKRGGKAGRGRGQRRREGKRKRTEGGKYRKRTEGGEGDRDGGVRGLKQQWEAWVVKTKKLGPHNGGATGWEPRGP